MGRRLPIAPELTEEDNICVENVKVILDFLMGANGSSSDTFREVHLPDSWTRPLSLSRLGHLEKPTQAIELL